MDHMFHTLNGLTFETVKQTSIPVGTQVPTCKTSRFLGARARSTSGCFRCRKRRKKCDEVHPVCARCKSQNDVCIWPEKTKGSRVEKPSVGPENRNISETLDISKTLDNSEPQGRPDIKSVGSENMAPVKDENTLEDLNLFFNLDLVVHDMNEFKNDLANFQMELCDQEAESEPAIPMSAAQIIQLYPTASFEVSDFSHASRLESQGLVYLEYYQKEYCTFVSIGLESSNYFALTFLGLAKTNDSIAYALAAWGGFYLELRKEKSDFAGPWRYMQEAAKSMCQQVGQNLQPRNKEQILYLFAFYLIFIGMEVCTGDIRNWRSFMSQCARLLRSCGGLCAVSNMFERNNDIQWMISDFECHDIVSSKALASGPIFSIQEYETALDRGLSYGIDPLQGIVNPLYKLMCYIGSTKAELNEDRKRIESLIRNGGSQANEMRTTHYEKVQSKVEDFTHYIDTCQPQSHHMALLDTIHNEKVLHLHLFDLYRYVCKIQLATAIERLPPKTVRIQHLLLKSLGLIDILSKTRFKVSLSLSLMVCGMACTTAYDRAQMIERFRSHRKQYELGNLQRIEETLTEVWNLNPTGDTCIDWADYVGEKGWHLYLG